MLKKAVVLHKRGFHSHGRPAAEPPASACSPGGKRGSARAPRKPREGSTQRLWLCRGFPQAPGCKEPRAEEGPSPPTAQLRLVFQQQELQNADAQRPRP